MLYKIENISLKIFPQSRVPAGGDCICEVMFVFEKQAEIHADSQDSVGLLCGEAYLKTK